jgi:hypothetical protein
MHTIRYIAGDKVVAALLPCSQIWKSIPGEYIFAGAPYQDLIIFSIIYNVVSFVYFAILSWSGSRGLGSWVILASPFPQWSPVVSHFPIRGGKNCSNGTVQNEKEVPVCELPAGY